MSSSNFDYVSVLWAYDVQTALLFALFSFVYALQYQVGFLRLVDGNHFHFEVLPTMDHSWERLFANFALEFGEVVGNNHASDFLLHFTVNPHFETLHMDTLAWATAFARRDHKIVGSVVVTKAEFAITCNMLVGFMDSVEFTQKKIFFLLTVFAWKAADFNNPVLDSTQFNDVAWT